MRTITQTVHIGDDVGPVDWVHPMAADKPDLWREAEANPEGFTYGDYERPIIKVCMYDGWPYWRPTPSILYVGPLGGCEWASFNSYGAGIQRKRHPSRTPSTNKADL